jgi:Tol biopolymer transport system component
VELSHWTFYPRFSPDGTQLFYSYDPKDPYNSYRVDLAIFASPADAGSQASTEWTYPNPYTGGDVNPVPLNAGGLIFTRFSIDDKSKVHSQIWLQARPGSAGVALTKPETNCLQPAVSSDQKLLAMVCTNGQTESADLQVAPFDPSALALGAPAVLVTGQLVASPAFSPDGATIAYLAPATAGGPFQLWTVPSAASAKSSSPRQITTDLALDSTSAPVWLSKP